jgi:hypothetical protein
VEIRSESDSNHSAEFIEQRVRPRYQLNVDIRVYARNNPVIRGHTSDISESGVSAVLREEVPVGEIVRLEFTVPHGEVEVLAVVRQRNAFRYGFQFLEVRSTQDVIGRTCRQFAVGQAAHAAQTP